MGPNPEMDKAAEVAAKELEALPEDAVKTVSTWLRQHYLKAGYKRLGRVLLSKTGNQIAEELKDLV